MITPPDRTIRKFNPGTFQTDTDVIRQFVVRDRELKIVLDVLNDNIGSPSCQHTLLVAPRGHGKTMLLSRVAAELRTNDALALRLLPVRFMEESLEVVSVGDFWLEALFHLAVETADADPTLSRDLRAARDDLARRWHGDELHLRARATVLDAADRLGRRLVLMVENLQDLCADVDDDFGWKLREALQTEPQIMLLATATSRFKGLDDPAQPFFEQFRTVILEPLETDECRRLWELVSGDDVKHREIRPLQILTGGNPRLLIIVAQFARHRSLRQLMDELMTLIDDHTEYFRSHLQGIPKTERLVYLAVIDLWQPSSTAEIAARCRRDVRTVSAMLGRLANRGAVSVEGRDRKRRYAAAEPLYSIYYKLRRERDEAAVIQNLIRFMAAFYRLSDLEHTIAALREATTEPAVRAGIERACAADPKVSDYFSSALRSHTKHVAAAWKLFDKSLTRFMRGEHDAGVQVCSELIERFGNSMEVEIEQAVAGALVNKGLSLRRQDRFADSIKVYDELISRFGNSQALPVQEHIANAMFHKADTLLRQERTTEVIEACDEIVERFRSCQALDMQHHVARALLNKGVMLRQADRLTDAIEVYDELIDRYGDSEAPEAREYVARALLNKGLTLNWEDKYGESIDVYDDLLDRYGKGGGAALHTYVAHALFNKGATLARQEGNSDAIEVYDDLIDRFGGSDVSEIQELVANALSGRGYLLWKQNRYSDAIRTCDELVERFGNSEVIELQEYVVKALFNKGTTLWQQREHECVIEVYNELVERFGLSDVLVIQEEVAHALFNKGVVLGQMGRFTNAIEVYDELVERFGNSETAKLREPVAIAVLFKADSYLELDRVREGLDACGVFEQLYKRVEGATDLELRGLAALIKTRALIRKGDIQAAASLFRSAYAAFIPSDEMKMDQMLKLLIDFAASGDSRTLLDMLLMDDDKADKLAPFIVVLRKEVGEEVRAPAEVMEVVDDIIEQIERRRASAGRS